MKVFRVEHCDTFRGPCYDECGQFDPIILCNGKEAVDLPMSFNEEYCQGDINWYAAGESIEDMKKWFNARNMGELLLHGFVLRMYEVSEAFECEGHLKFDRRSIKMFFNLDASVLVD